MVLLAWFESAATVLPVCLKHVVDGGMVRAVVVVVIALGVQFSNGLQAIQISLVQCHIFHISTHLYAIPINLFQEQVNHCHHQLTKAREEVSSHTLSNRQK